MTTLALVLGALVLVAAAVIAALVYRGRAELATTRAVSAEDHAADVARKAVADVAAHEEETERLHRDVRYLEEEIRATDDDLRAGQPGDAGRRLREVLERRARRAGPAAAVPDGAPTDGTARPRGRR